jgi:hypothetical protein
MMGKTDDRQFGPEESRKRLEAALKGARLAGHKPMESLTGKKPKAKKVVKKVKSKKAKK